MSAISVRKKLFMSPHESKSGDFSWSSTASIAVLGKWSKDKSMCRKRERGREMTDMVFLTVLRYQTPDSRSCVGHELLTVDLTVLILAHGGVSYTLKTVISSKHILRHMHVNSQKALLDGWGHSTQLHRV